MARFVQCDRFNVIVSMIGPGKRIVIVNLSPCDIKFTVIVNIRGISIVVREDDRERYTQYVGTPLGTDEIKKIGAKPSGVNDISDIVQATAEAKQFADKTSRIFLIE